ncbi:protein G12-like [Culicoides brevitarsis]|uniref:protein G12-like n=1 Tax=Culicoides brevitarsis TaxID=469753 RepID=UPI00307CBC8C
MTYVHLQTVTFIFILSMVRFCTALDDFYKIREEKTTFSHLENEGDFATDIPVSTPESTDLLIGTLQMDLYEFVDLVPVHEVNEILERYYISDTSIRKVYDFIGKYNYSFVDTKLTELIEVKRALRFFKRKNINLDEFKQYLYERFGPHKINITFETIKYSNYSGFYAMVDDILDEIPHDELVTLFFEKMETSNDFSDFLNWIGGEDFEEMKNALRLNKEVQRFVFGLRNNGVDIIKLFNILKNYFGFGFK